MYRFKWFLNLEILNLSWNTSAQNFIFERISLGAYFIIKKVLSNMVESSYGTKKVVAIGMLGVGKSTLLNCVLNLNTDKPFIALNSADGVT